MTCGRTHLSYDLIETILLFFFLLDNVFGGVIRDERLTETISGREEIFGHRLLGAEGGGEWRFLLGFGRLSKSAERDALWCERGGSFASRSGGTSEMETRWHSLRSVPRDEYFFPASIPCDGWSVSETRPKRGNDSSGPRHVNLVSPFDRPSTKTGRPSATVEKPRGSSRRIVEFSGFADRGSRPGRASLPSSDAVLDGASPFEGIPS